MRQFKVKKGKHTFFSTRFPWLPCLKTYINKNSFIIDFELSEQTKYYMLLDDGYDKDQYDWNIKVAPHSFGIPFNKYAIMPAVRFDPINNLFEITCYSNNNFSYKAGTEENEVMLKGDVGKYRWEAKKLETSTWEMKISGFLNNQWVTVKTVHTVDSNSNIVIVAPSWFGGENNEKGEYGGVAPQDLLIRINSKKK